MNLKMLPSLPSKLNVYLFHSLTAQVIIYPSYIAPDPEVRTMSLQQCDSNEIGSTLEKDAMHQVNDKACSIKIVKILLQFNTNNNERKM
jgi:hypothetical protein